MPNVTATSKCSSPKCCSLYLESTLEEVLLLPRVAQPSVGVGEVGQRNRDLKVILPEVFFFYLKGSFGGGPSSCCGRPVSIGVGEVAQRIRDLKVILPEVSFLYPKGSFEEVLLLPRIAQVSIGVGEVAQRFSRPRSAPPRSVFPQS